jgi:predicted N-acetyltransferase YhbS
LAAQSSGSARVFITLDKGDVVGFYALTASEVSPSQASKRAMQGQPRERAVPAILLARLAVTRSHQGTGIGRSLLQDAMLRCGTAAEQIGARVLLVHAKDDAARDWYRRFGFEESPTDPLHLMLLMKDLRRFLDRAEGEQD